MESEELNEDDTDAGASKVGRYYSGIHRANVNEVNMFLRQGWRAQTTTTTNHSSLPAGSAPPRARVRNARQIVRQHSWTGYSLGPPWQVPHLGGPRAELLPQDYAGGLRRMHAREFVPRRG